MVAQVKLKPTHAQPGLFRSPTRGSFCPTILPIAPITTPRDNLISNLLLRLFRWTISFVKPFHYAIAHAGNLINLCLLFCPIGQKSIRLGWLVCRRQHRGASSISQTTAQVGYCVLFQTHSIMPCD